MIVAVMRVVIAKNPIFVDSHIGVLVSLARCLQSAPM